MIPKTICVIVEKSKELINKVCRVAFENGYKLDSCFGPKNPKEFTDEEMEALIKEDPFCGYNARAIYFNIIPKEKILEIYFRDTYPDDTSLSRTVYTGRSKTELEAAIDWIKNQRV